MSREAKASAVPTFASCGTCCLSTFADEAMSASGDAQYGPPREIRSTSESRVRIRVS